MCGRYALYALGPEVWAEFDLEGPPWELAPRDDIRPTEEVLVIGMRPGAARPRPAMMRWGLVPFFADDLKMGSKLINARSETATSKPSFRDSMERRRCLVVANGFYEWKRVGKAKERYLLEPAGGGLVAFAGLWASNRRVEGASAEAPLLTCTVLTEPATGAVAELHDRMPVVVPRASYSRWIDCAGLDAAGALGELHSGAAMEWVGRRWG
jgi:putative SOS response-associated peptidase YedK